MTDMGTRRLHRRRPRRGRPDHRARRAPPGAGRRGAVRRPHRPGPARTGAAGALGRRGQARLLPTATGQATINALLVQACARSDASWCGSRAATRACSAGSKRSCRRWPRPASPARWCPASPPRWPPRPHAQRPLTRRGSGRSVSLTTAMTQRRRAARPAAAPTPRSSTWPARQLARAGAPAARSRLGGRHAGAAWSRAPAGPTSLHSDHTRGRAGPRPRCCTPVGPTVVTVGAGAAPLRRAASPQAR